MIQKAIQYPALIKYLKGYSNYSWLHYCDGTKVLVAKSLCYFEKKLPGFFRVHKTALVNPHYITDFMAPPGHKMSGSIRLKDGETLPVSRRRWNHLIDPMSVAMLQTSDVFTPAGHRVASEPAERPSAEPAKAARTLWVVMADEVKGGLLRQLIRERWPQWQIRVFETGSSLLKALSGVAEPESPGLMVLDGSELRSGVTLESIKGNLRFRRIPIVMLAPHGNPGQAEQGYASGANSVVVHSNDLTRFLQVLEKIFRYWLSVASAPVIAAITPSLAYNGRGRECIG
ncbi:response regulator transcription factor [Larkinella bovis]|uniref:Response regulator transcription factor n=1 Tax=Larkinella bovis TaxID=683041 RepID=A0ABW0IFW1_9BACT